MPKSKKYVIRAVHDKDVRKLLESLKLTKKFDEGGIICKFCERKITYDNFQCIYPLKDEIVFCCSNIKCFNQAMKNQREVNDV